MNDDQSYGYASALANMLFVLQPDESVVRELLDVDRYFEGKHDAICIAHQLIAEATGLVGEGDV